MDVLPGGHDQGRSIVTGDFDLANAGDLLVRVTGLIGSAGRNIGLDPCGVNFIDCAGLRIPAAVRVDGASVRLTAMSPVVVLLLELAGAIHDTTAPAAAPAGGPAYATACRTLTTDRAAPV